MNTGDENKKARKSKKKGSRLPYTIFYSVVFVAALVLIAIPQLNNSRCPPSAWEGGAKSVLMGIYETQEAYQQQYNTVKFATWDELTKADFICEGYTKVNIIGRYSLYEHVWNDYEDSLYPSPNRFTLVAFPTKAGCKGRLSTFAIREDGILRKYKKPRKGIRSWGEDGDYGCRTWTPVK
jgi:hypothetical protein